MNRTLIFSASSFGLATFAVIALVILLAVLPVSAQTLSPLVAPTVVPPLTSVVPPPTNTVAIPAPTVDAVSQVAQTSQEVLEAVKHATTLALNVITITVGIMGTLITVIVGVVAGITAYRGKVAEEKASEAQVKAERASSLSDQLSGKLLRYEDIIQSAVHTASTAKASAESAQGVAEEARDTLKSVRSKTKRLEGTLRIFGDDDLQFLATLRLIDVHRGALYNSRDSRARDRATWALLEKTHAESPLIRRECLWALSRLPAPNDGVLERFEEIVVQECDPEILWLAQETLKTWQSVARGNRQVSDT